MSIEEYLNFIEDAFYDRKGGLEGQRGPLQTNSAIRIRKTMISDLEAGAILPPIVVGLIVDEGTLTGVPDLKPDTLRDLLDDHVPIENISVIDGMQRTAALMELRENPELLKRKLRIEFWLTSNTNSLIYRMLVLNTGQVPWDLRRQIEVVHKPLIKELKRHTDIEVLEKDELRRRTKPGQFQADRIIEMYMAFGARKEKIDTRERLANDFTRLDFIEATSVSNFTFQFFSAIHSLATLDRAFDNYDGIEIAGRFTAGRDIFSSHPACVGFIASVAIDVFGRPGAPERTQHQQEENLKRIEIQVAALTEHLKTIEAAELGEFLDLDTLNEVVSDKSVGKVGDFEREFFLKAFQTLIEEKFTIARMTPCWRAY